MVNRKLIRELNSEVEGEVTLPSNWDTAAAKGQMDLTEDPDRPITLQSRVVRIVDNTVWVDAGRKNELEVSLDEWKGEEPPKVGDEISIVVEPTGFRSFRIAPHPKETGSWQAKCERLWESLASVKPGDRINGTVGRAIRGGFLVALETGHNAFLPASRADTSSANPVVNSSALFEVTSVSVDRRNLIVKLAVSE